MSRPNDTNHPRKHCGGVAVATGPVFIDALRARGSRVSVWIRRPGIEGVEVVTSWPDTRGAAERVLLALEEALLTVLAARPQEVLLLADDIHVDRMLSGGSPTYATDAWEGLQRTIRHAMARGVRVYRRDGAGGVAEIAVAQAPS